MGLFSKSGTLEIQLDQPSIAIGENLTGNIVIDLDKRLTGCTLNIELIGYSYREQLMLERDSSSDTPRSKFFQQKDALLEDATIETTRSMHPFSVCTPADLGSISLNLPQGALGAMAETFLENLASRLKYSWRLHARLVIPGMFNDLKADIEVQIDIPEDRIR
jgi:hypothetical protein